ncbi:MAG: DUF3108 domain-containing protein [bacterium]|nr:DUF3108 domain-containing protein [Candidatus Kapabacteria bacterium]
MTGTIQRSFFQRLAPIVGTAMLAVALVFGLMAAGGETTSAWQAQADGALRIQPNSAFTYGEKLTFSVGYKFITAGYAVMAVTSKPVQVAGRPTYEVKFDVKTTPSFDKIFKVRDHYATYLDADGIFPWRFEQSVREGDYSRDFSANIDQRKHVARTTDGAFTVSPFVHDILSAFYYARTLDLKKMKKGQSFQLKNFYGKKAHDLKIRILGRQKVETKAGTFNCVVIEPLVVDGGLFKNEGRIVVYMTDDDRKIPVKVSTKVVIGSIDSELVSYSGVKGAIAAKIK